MDSQLLGPLSPDASVELVLVFCLLVRKTVDYSILWGTCYTGFSEGHLVSSLTVMIVRASGPGTAAPRVAAAMRGLQGPRHFSPGREPP